MVLLLMMVHDAEEVNTNTDTYVSWNWKGGGSGSANTDGSISSTVSANTTAGFSMVKYTVLDQVIQQIQLVMV